MSFKRIISRIDVKGDNLVKGMNLEGLKILGKPWDFSKHYYEKKVDEIIFFDTVASLYGRNNLLDIVEKVSKNVFIPITVGGGIRSINNAYEIFRCGADKIAINTAAVKNPMFLTELVKEFGSQSIIASIEAKKITNGKWEVYTECGREKTGLDVIEWAKKCVSLGVGEILITSVDKEGTCTGFDIELTKEMTRNFNIPIIASGGMGNYNHLVDLIEKTNIDAVCIASILHYKKFKLNEIREFYLNKNFNVKLSHD